MKTFQQLCLTCVFALALATATGGSQLPENLPASVLSPIVGPLRVISSNQPVCDGIWEFNQYKSVSHNPVGGIARSNDRHAWDINLCTPTNKNADADKPVFAVAEGQVVKYAGTKPGGGAVLIAHPNAENPVWFSGYLHLRKVNVSLNQQVDVSTVIGDIGEDGTSSEHLHFVVYSGENKRGKLRSFNVTITERRAADSQSVALL
ncbi:MAG TPA: M23 family metallopeptidase [Pyrinomonadaceae bacterium]|nr:M23 family metallopeptidase [Pyrinomonadaceae bacterium]